MNNLLIYKNNISCIILMFIKYKNKLKETSDSIELYDVISI